MFNITWIINPDNVVQEEKQHKRTEKENMLEAKIKRQINHVTKNAIKLLEEKKSKLDLTMEFEITRC